MQNLNFALAVVTFAAIAIGCLFAAWAVHDTVADRRALYVSGLNGARTIVASRAVRTALTRAACQVLVGVAAGASLSAQMPEDHHMVVPMVIRSCLCAVTLLLVSASVADRLDRRHLVHLIHALESKEKKP